MSCFCAFFIDENYDLCISLAHVGDWWIHFIVPLNFTYVQNVAKGANDQDDWEHGRFGEQIVQSLDIGDNFTMNATPNNEEHCEFYVVCCERPLIEVGANGLRDDWGNSFKPKVVVVGVRYYQRLGMSYISLLVEALLILPSFGLHSKVCDA
jgi:hypothetical protein